jgi:hypothetical protein
MLSLFALKMQTALIGVWRNNPFKLIMLPPQLIRLVFSHLPINLIYRAARSSKNMYSSLVASEAA